jgi:hypothetical protein
VVVLILAGARREVAQGAEQRDPIQRCAPSPPNLQVERRLQPIVHEMWHRSPTFRRQVMRLTREPDLVVTIAVWRQGTSTSPRATTRLTRDRWLLRGAEVQVKLADEISLVELIAHELEHVLEQLDDVNLSVHSARGQGVIKETDSRGEPWFETARAQQVGRAAAAEFRAGASGEGGCDEAPR